MGCAATCTGFNKSETGVITVTYDGGTQREYESVADMYNDVFGLDSDVANARKWLLALYLFTDPAISNPQNYLIGKTCTLNVGAAEPIKLV